MVNGKITYNILDLFSGIGGMSLGLERAGMNTVAFCEIDPYCQKVLNKHWPDVPIYEDVRNITNEFTGSVDVICGGYPCQPFSTAGKRKGAEDDRHLWPAMFDCIKAYRPRWVIGENVAGHISMGIDSVLSDLESEGYTTQAFVIPACAVNAPHRRDRVWIVGNAKHNGLSAATGSGCVQYQSEKQGRQEQKREFARTGCSSEDVAYTKSEQGDATNHGREQGKVSESQQSQLGRRDRGTLRGSYWETEPELGRVADGIPNGMDRLKCLGNAVVPQIPEIIGRAIMEADKHG